MLQVGDIYAPLITTKHSFAAAECMYPTRRRYPTGPEEHLPSVEDI